MSNTNFHQPDPRLRGDGDGSGAGGDGIDPASLQLKTVKTTDNTGELPAWAAWVADTSTLALSRPMPTAPTDGMEVTVHDINGNAETNNITLTVTPPTTIAQPVISTNSQSKKWRYDATGDVWDLVFSSAPAGGGGGEWTPIPLVNGGFETGDSTGWTILNGTLDFLTSNPAPHEGAYYQGHAVASFVQAYQEVDLTLYADDATLDGLMFLIHYAGMQAAPSTTDTGYIWMEWRTAADALILRRTTPLVTMTPANTWVQVDIAEIAPEGARKLRVGFYGDRNTGIYNDAYFDALTLEYMVVSPTVIL